MSNIEISQAVIDRIKTKHYITPKPKRGHVGPIKYTSFSPKPKMSLFARSLTPGTDRAISLAIHDSSSMTHGRAKFHERFPDGECPICLERLLRDAAVTLVEEDESPLPWSDPNADPIADLNAVIERGKL